MAEVVKYNPRAGRYVGADGKFISQNYVKNLLTQEIQQTEVRLAALGRLLTSDKISLPEWEQRFAETVRASHLRAAALGSGGREQMGARHFGAVGYQLQQQYSYLDRFAGTVAAGNLTPGQIIQRSRLYAKSSKISFYRAQQLSRVQEGQTEGKRSLDPLARHCASCIRYSTKGQWVPIEQIIPPGTNCECGNNCRCSVAYRQSPVNLNVGTLSANTSS